MQALDVKVADVCVGEVGVLFGVQEGRKVSGCRKSSNGYRGMGESDRSLTDVGPPEACGDRYCVQKILPLRQNPRKVSLLKIALEKLASSKLEALRYLSLGELRLAEVWAWT